MRLRLSPWHSVILLGAAVVGAVVLRLMVGGSVGDDLATIVELRLERVLVGLVVGGCLGLGGVLLQNLLRNPLASPDLIGVAPAASLGVITAAYVRLASSGDIQSVGGEWGGNLGWDAGPALVAALACLTLVWWLGQRRGVVDPRSLILIGVMIGVMCGAGVMLVQHLLPALGASGMGIGGGTRLLVGAINDNVPHMYLVAAACALGVGVAVSLVLARSMDAMVLGEDEAASVGVHVPRVRLVLLVLAGLLTAAAVVLAGPVGFVGLVSPHAVRLLGGLKGGHRVLVIGSTLAGAALVVAADALVKSIPLSTGRLPLGIVTALLGGPALIVLIRRGE